MLLLTQPRYEYDDHYFLTDPKEFIYEFFPLQPEWQLLKTPITLKEFEDLPFVRSLFFRYGLYFPDGNTKAVMVTDSTGKSHGVCFPVEGFDGLIHRALTSHLFSCDFNLVNPRCVSALMSLRDLNAV